MAASLTNRAQLQAFRFGAKFSTPSQALSLSFRDGEHGAALHLEGCTATLRAKCVIIATGADYNRIEAEGREHFEGLGVYYAATALEGQLCRGSTVIVAGGGNSAGQAAMFLSEVRGESPPRHPWRRSFQKHVELPLAPGGDEGEHRDSPPHRDPENDRRKNASKLSNWRTLKPASAAPCRRPPSFP